MTSVYIGLGGNLGAVIENLTAAVKLLANIPQTSLISKSSWYQSKAIGPGDQGDYINGACHLQTSLDPISLLDQTQAIENHLGRVRNERWGPRSVDLDILLFGDLAIKQERLTIPHPEMMNRNFVIQPLFEIAPSLIFKSSESLESVANKSGWNGLKKLVPVTS